MNPHFLLLWSKKISALACFFHKAGQLSRIMGNHQLFIGWNDQTAGIEPVGLMIPELP